MSNCTDCTPLTDIYTNNICLDLIKSGCINYNGNNLSSLNINSGDNFDTILQKINTVINSLSSQIENVSYICPTLQNVTLTKINSNSVSVSYTTNDSSATFKYTVDGGSLILVPSNPFTISDLSTSSHTIVIKTAKPDGTICATDSDTIDLGVIVNEFSIGWSATDPYIDDNSEPNFTVQSTGNIVNNQINADFHNMPSQYYPIIKVPVGAPIFTTVYDTPFNNATIPDTVWRSPFLVDGVDRYYVGRIPTDFDTTPNHTVLIS